MVWLKNAGHTYTLDAHGVGQGEIAAMRRLLRTMNRHGRVLMSGSARATLGNTPSAGLAPKAGRVHRVGSIESSASIAGRHGDTLNIQADRLCLVRQVLVGFRLGV